jgi:hypothetical protein
LEAYVKQTVQSLYMNNRSPSSIEYRVRNLLILVAKEQRKVTLDYVGEVVGPVPFNDQAVPLVTEGP